MFSHLNAQLLVDEMNLEQKIGQLLMTYFEGEEINEHAQRLICEMHVGGIIYYERANILRDPVSVQRLSNDLQNFSGKQIDIPLFIAVDQEGGVVAQLKNGFTISPGNEALGRTHQPSLAYAAAKVTGSELKAVGINLNFSPVIDVNSNPKNPVIGTRSFSHDPKVVTRFGRQAIKGYLDSGIIPCCKHFPGHGDTHIDSHSSLPVVNKSFSDLCEEELYPFLQLFEATPMIMTAHVLYPSLDSTNCATLSKSCLKDLLRDKWGYKGILITDSLTMKGVAKGSGDIVEVAICAFEAGNDILLIGDWFPHNPKMIEPHVKTCLSVYKGLLEAVRGGRITEERVDQSVQRILNLKTRVATYL